MTTPADLSLVSYHRLPRSDPRHRWWRPLAVGLVAAGLYLAALVAFTVVVVGLGLAVPSVGLALDRSWESEPDFGDPATFALLLGLVVLMLPALLTAARLAGSRPLGLLSSVTGRLRSSWLRSCTVLALAIWVPVMAVWVAVEAATGTLQVRHVAPATTLALLATTLALVPLQAATEEYIFRGYFAQLFGSWLRHPAFAVLLPIPLFVAAHGYGTLGAIEVGAFALMSGWLAWRTGGLEAPIAAHVVNNVVLMSLNAAGLGNPNATDTSPAGLGVSLAIMAAFTVLATRRADSSGIARTRSVNPVPERALAAPGRPTGSSPHVEIARH